jgi:uncharacterized protein (UPF0218 family)
MSNTDYVHATDDGKEFHWLVDGCEDMAASFVGREDAGTVTLYAIDPDNPVDKIPIMECEKEHFELVLEQASGALMNAEGDYPNMPEMERND